MHRILPIKVPYQLYQQQIPMHHSYLNLPFLNIHTFCEYMVKGIGEKPFSQLQQVFQFTET